MSADGDMPQRRLGPAAAAACMPFEAWAEAYEAEILAVWRETGACHVEADLEAWARRWWRSLRETHGNGAGGG